MLLVVPGDTLPSKLPPSPLPTPTCKKKMMMMLRNQLSRTETSLCPWHRPAIGPQLSVSFIPPITKEKQHPTKLKWMGRECGGAHNLNCIFFLLFGTFCLFSFYSAFCFFYYSRFVATHTHTHTQHTHTKTNWEKWSTQKKNPNFFLLFLMNAHNIH
jgi:hypothetical protein